jgi:hypothetical protein
MTPILLFALIAGIAGWSLHKRWYGVTYFCTALLIWMLLMQMIIAYSMHWGVN